MMIWNDSRCGYTSRRLRGFDDPDYIDDLEESLQDQRIRMQLVLHNEEPIAYMQGYLASR